jgi:hypothetical protein
MSQTTQAAADWLNLVLNGIAIANLADNAGTGPLTALYISLHTGSPGASGNQTTNEAAYAGYARIPVARNSGAPAWTISGNQASPNAAIGFAQATGGSETEAFMGIGTSLSGSGKLLWFGTITPNIAVSSGVTPQLTTGTTVTGT